MENTIELVILNYFPLVPYLAPKHNVPHQKCYQKFLLYCLTVQNHTALVMQRHYCILEIMQHHNCILHCRVFFKIIAKRRGGNNNNLKNRKIQLLSIV